MPASASSILSGLSATNNVNTDLRVRAVIRKMSLEEPMNTPLWAITERANRKNMQINLTAKGWKVEWINKGRFPRILTVGSTAPTTGTSMIVNNVLHSKAGDVLEYQRENMLVTAVNSTTNTLTLVRNTPSRTGGGIVPIPAGAVVKIASTAAEQGAPKGPRFSIQPTLDSNVTQIFRAATGITKTQAATTQYHTTSEFEDNIKDAVDNVREQVERQMLMHWGKSELPPTGLGATNYNRNIAAGLPAYIVQNYINAGGSMNSYELNEYMNRAIRYGGNKKRLLLGGQTAGSIISQFSAGTIRTTIKNNFWGANITRLGGSGNWQAEVLQDYQLESDYWAYLVFALDMQYIGRYDLRRLDINRDASDPGTDSNEAEVIMEATTIVANPKAHAIIHNVNY